MLINLGHSTTKLYKNKLMTSNSEKYAYLVYTDADEATIHRFNMEKLRCTVRACAMWDQREPHDGLPDLVHDGYELATA